MSIVKKIVSEVAVDALERVIDSSLDLTGKTVAIIGDSITAQNTTVSATADKFEAQGYMVAYNFISYNRLDFQPIYNLGVGGEVLSEIALRKTSLAALNPDIVVILGGSNDIISSTTAAQMQTSLEELRDYTTNTLNAVCLMLTIPPRTQVGGTALSGAQQTKLDDVNSFILGQSIGNVYPIDIYSALVSTGTDNPDPLYFKNESGTLLHPNPEGAFVIGQQIKSTLDPVFGNYSSGQWKTGTNLLSVEATTGTGGTKDANVTGDVATGFDIDSIGTANSAFRTASKTADDYQRLVLDVPSGNTSDEGMIYLMGTEDVTVGAEYYGEFLADYTTVTNVDQIVFECREEGDGVSNISHDSMDDQNALQMPEYGEGLGRTPRFRVSSALNKKIRPRLIIEGNATAQALYADVTAKEFRLVKTADPVYVNQIEESAVAEFDFSNPLCLPASTGTINNLLGDTNEDFWMGSDGTTAAPNINGTLGVEGSYLESAGTDYIDIKNISNSVLRKFHRSDNQGWIAYAFKYEATGMNNDYLFGNRINALSLGIGLRVGSDNQLDGFQSNGASSSTIASNDFLFVDGEDYLLFLSLDGTSATDNISLWVNSRTLTDANSVGFQASTTDSSDIFSFMTAASSSGGSLPAGSGAFGAMWGTGLLNNDKVDAITDYIAEYRGYGSIVTW